VGVGSGISQNITFAGSQFARRCSPLGAVLSSTARWNCCTAAARHRTRRDIGTRRLLITTARDFATPHIASSIYQAVATGLHRAALL